MFELPLRMQYDHALAVRQDRLGFGLYRVLRTVARDHTKGAGVERANSNVEHRSGQGFGRSQVASRGRARSAHTPQALAMLGDVLEALAASSGVARTLVVTADADVAAFARHAGADEVSRPT